MQRILAGLSVLTCLVAGASVRADDSIFQEPVTGRPSGEPVPRLIPATRPSGSPDRIAGQTVAFDDSSAEETFDSRLADLEEAWSKFQASEAKKKSDAAKKPTFVINGRIHADYWSFINSSEGAGYLENPTTGDDPEDRFLFRRIRLEMKGDILDSMLWRIQTDFNNPSSGEMKDVYLGFKNLPFNQQLLIGNQKRPIGLDHLNSSRFNVFVERPMVVEAFNEDARRPGVAMYGFTDDELYHWRYGVYYLENISRDGRTIGDSRQMSVNGRLSSSPWYDTDTDGAGYFHWAVSGMVARPDGDADRGFKTNSNDGRFRTRPEARSNSRWVDTGRIDGAEWYQTVGVESILNVGPLQVVGEYQHNFMQRDTGSDLQFHGGYVYVSYFLTGEHIPYSRRSGTIGRVKPYENFFLVDRCNGGFGHGWGAWNVAARYSYLDLSDDNVLGGVGTEWTAAINWFWTPFSKVQFDLSYVDISDRRSTGGFTGGHSLIAGTRFAIEF